MMQGRLLTLCLLCLLLATPAAALKIPLLQEALGPSAPAIPTTQPEPTALQAGWWHYFDVADAAELATRIDKVTQRLQTLLQTLPSEMTAAAHDHIELISANLQVLPGARAQVAPERPPPPAYQERYSLSELLQRARQLREARAEAVSERIDVSAAENAVEAVSRNTDTQLAAYLNLAPSAPQRVLRGLEIMADRTSLIVAKERLRLSTAELQALATQIEHWDNELKTARKRLQARPQDLARLAQAIDNAEAALEQAHAQAARELTAASRIVGNTPEDKATTLFRQQRVIKATVEEATEKVRLLWLRAEQALSKMLLAEVVAIAELRQQLAIWKTTLSDIAKQTSAWSQNSGRERSRTGAAVATLPEQKPVHPTERFLALLNEDRFNLAQETLVIIERLHAISDQANLVLDLVDEQLLRQEGRLRDWLAWIVRQSQQLQQQAAGWIHISLFKIGETPVTAVGLLQVLVILTLAWLMSYWLRRGLAELGGRGDDSNAAAFYTIGRLSHYLFILLGFLLGLSSIGMDFTNFALVAGALAIGIGFGLQAIVNNFISGLILLFERSLKVGDFIQLASGVVGEVKAINVRSTQIKTNENIDIVVPNSEFMNTNVINWTLQEPSRRVHYPFRVAYGADKDLVRKAGLEACENVSHTLSGIPGKNPQVWLVGYGENGYNFELVVWLTPSAVKRPSAVQAAYYWALETALTKYEVEVPVPQRDLRLRGGFGELLEASKPAQDEAADKLLKEKPLRGVAGV